MREPFAWLIEPRTVADRDRAGHPRRCGYCDLLADDDADRSLERVPSARDAEAWVCGSGSGEPRIFAEVCFNVESVGVEIEEPADARREREEIATAADRRIELEMPLARAPHAQDSDRRTQRDR